MPDKFSAGEHLIWRGSDGYDRTVLILSGREWLPSFPADCIFGYRVTTHWSPLKEPSGYYVAQETELRRHYDGGRPSTWAACGWQPNTEPDRCAGVIGNSISQERKQWPQVDLTS